MLTNSLAKCFQQLSVRAFHPTPALSSSVFIKKARKVDPEVAKIREKRKRRKIEGEIRRLQRQAKKPKPVTEFSISPKIEENIAQYQREQFELTDAEVDERAVLEKTYAKSRNKLMIEDNNWIRHMLKEQEKALKTLKEISPELYQAAIQPDGGFLPCKFQGPMLTAPIKDYHAPDGDFVDTTPDYNAGKKLMPSLIKT